METDEAKVSAGYFEVEREFRAVICLNTVRTIRHDRSRFLEEVGSRERTVIGVAGGKGCPCFRIDTRDDVALAAIEEADNGIDFKDTTAFRSPKFLFPFLSVFQELSCFCGKGKALRIRQSSLLFQVRKNTSDRRNREGISLC